VSMPWETVPDGKEKYLAYLSSRDRALLEEEVRSRSGGLCERCLGHPSTQVRLMTYAALYRATPEDLLHLCVPCDEFLCGQRRRDPFLDVPVRADGTVVETVYLAGKITGTTWRDEIVDASSVGNEGGWSAENHSGIEVEALSGEWVDTEGCLPLPDGRRLTLTGPYWKNLNDLGGHGTIGWSAVAYVPHQAGAPGDEEILLDQAHAYIPLETVSGTGCVVRRADFEGEWALTREMRALHALIVRTIRASDVLFAWIDSLDCYGTLHEIGLALGLGKLVVVACHRDLNVREIWLSCHGARLFVRAASPRDAWAETWNIFAEQAHVWRAGARIGDPGARWRPGGRTPKAVIGPNEILS